MKSRQSRKLLALIAMMCGISGAFTNGGENNDVDYIKNLMKKTSISNQLKMLPDEELKRQEKGSINNGSDVGYIKDLISRISIPDLPQMPIYDKDARILHYLSTSSMYDSIRNELYSIMKRISVNYDDEDLVTSMKNLRELVDILVEKDLTNGIFTWDMRIVPRSGNTCLVPLNLYEYEIDYTSPCGYSPRSAKETLNYGCLIWAEFTLPKGWEDSYKNGKLTIRDVRLIPPELVSASVTSADSKSHMYLTGTIHGDIMSDAFIYWNFPQEYKQSNRIWHKGIKNKGN